MRMDRMGPLRRGVIGLGFALAAGAGLAGTAQAQGSGTCYTVDQTGWMVEVASIPLSQTVSFGPDLERLACEVAWQRLESAGEQRCASSYSDGTLYRNGQLVPVEVSFSDCRCQESNTNTTCQLSASVQCSYEVYRSAGTEVCN